MSAITLSITACIHCLIGNLILCDNRRAFPGMCRRSLKWPPTNDVKGKAPAKRIDMLWRGIVDKIVRVHLCYVVSRIVQCRFPYHAVSYPKMQCRTRRCNVVPGVVMSHPEMQCRTRRCNVVPGDAMSYPVL